MKLPSRNHIIILIGSLAALGAVLAWPRTSMAADYTVRQVTETVFKAAAGAPPDFSNKDLSFLDVAGLDFKAAKFNGANLYGTDFTAAYLRGADFSNAKLDRAVITRANFSGANLSHATLLRPTVHVTFAYDWLDAPRFAGSNLTGLRAMARLDGADFQGANLTDADFSPHEPRPGQGTLSTVKGNELRGCDFSNAILKNAKFQSAILVFAKFIGADLRDADLTDADLSKVNFANADLTGAKLGGADLDGAILTGARGLDTVIGLSTALNLDKATR